MKRKQHISMIFSFFIIFCIIFTGCGEQKDFDSFTDSIFKEEVTSDSLTLNYTLAKPEAYGITNFTPTLGTYSEKGRKQQLVACENRLAALKEYDYASLDDQQKVTYDTLKWLYQTLLTSANYDYYEEILGPTTGFQAQLPVLLSEYNFYDKDDIDAYLKLLEDTPTYFSQIIRYEKKKAKAGLFMSDDVADQIISQCQSFYHTGDNNCIIQVFNNRTNSFDWLTKEEKSAYQKKNAKAVKQFIIPAYENLCDALSSLKGNGMNEKGLCGLPEGKKYYEFLIRYTTGDDRTIPEINEDLDKAIDQSIQTLQNRLAENPKLLAKVAGIKYPSTNPEKILTYLKNAMKSDFPPIKDVTHSVHYVDPSLEEDLSPAFYLTPPLDAYQNNSIYINGSDHYDLSAIFPTLAHEGYPGHLYQTVYHLQQKPAPIRCLYSFGGYSEGWASYVEFLSYHYAGFEDAVANILEKNHIATLCMYAKIDLGVNYYGWDLSDTKKYLSKFGISKDSNIQTIYTNMVAEPGGYLKYADGYLNFARLRQEMEQKQGSSFTPLAFHTYILNMGPCPFSVLEKHLP